MTTLKPTEALVEDINKGETDNDVLYRAYAAKGDEWHCRMTKRVVRKVDLHLLPLVVLMYLMNFLDRKYVVGSYVFSCRDVYADLARQQSIPSPAWRSGKGPGHERNGLQSGDQHSFCGLLAHAAPVEPGVD